MYARRTLMQVATKLAIGLGALFLVGVLLAAIPNHRAPVVPGISGGPRQTAPVIDHATLPNTGPDKPISSDKDNARDHVTAPKAGHSVR